MSEHNLQNKVINAAKWSSVTEISAKLVSPITNMILARIIAPEAFGVVATITMVVSFADMFTDSGFQKYLVQHEFKDDKEKCNNANVAFFTNLGISILLWSLIILFRHRLASLVGSPGLGNVLAIASLQLPLTSFSSIQFSMYRRDFKFKTLFLVRIISIFIPFFITIPLAFMGMSYWSLIIGSLCIQISNAIVLTLKSDWKPKLYYNIIILKEMFSFSMWSLIEAISIWLTTWIDTFIIGSILNQYFLGIYKTSTTMVNALMALITSATMPILFSTLSRMQKDDNEFQKMFFKFQKLISMIILPLGVGVYLFSDLATQILLGNKWSEASQVVGMWALTSSVMIVFGNSFSEYYRSKGKPKLSFIAQLLHLIVLIPVCILSAKYGFKFFVYSRSLVRLQLVLVHLLIMKFKMKISLKSMFNGILPAIISTFIMWFFGFLLSQAYNGIVWSFISILLCLTLYMYTLYLFPSTQQITQPLINRFIKIRSIDKNKI